MWAEIGSGLGTLVVFGLVVRFQQARITRLDDGKVDVTMCDQKEGSFKEALLRGDKKFEKIDETQTQILTIVNTQATSIALIKDAVTRIEANHKRE